MENVNEGRQRREERSTHSSRRQSRSVESYQCLRLLLHITEKKRKGKGKGKGKEKLSRKKEEEGGKEK
jgi:hypothetical protein